MAASKQQKMTKDLTALEMQHLLENCKYHAPIINEKIRAFESDTNDRRLQIQAFGKELKDYLISSDLTYESVFLCMYVAVNPENRMKLMLDPINAQTLLRKIASKGWNWDEVILALANEIDPDDNTTILKNQQLVAKSNGLLAPIVNPEQMQIETVVCSHTTAVLRLAHYAATHAIKIVKEVGLEELAIDGILSQSRIFEKCASLKDPVDNGMRYTVTRHPIVKLCPRLMPLLAEADNAKHANYNKEKPLETMMNIHRLALAASSVGNDVDYSSIAKLVSRSHDAEFEKDATNYSVFVENYSGTDEHKNPTHLINLTTFQKGLEVARPIPSNFFAECGKLPMASADMYVIALIKATMSAPLTFCSTGKAKVFTSSDLQALHKGETREKALKTNGFMKMAADMLKKLGIENDSDAVHIQGTFETRLCMKVHDKRVPGRTNYGSLSEIGAAFYKELESKFGDRVTAVPNPWFSIELANSMPAPESKLARGLRELGVSNRDLQDKGFVLNVVVVKKDDKDKTRFVLKGLSNTITKGMSTAVELQREDDEKIKQAVPRAELLDMYEPVKDVKQDYDLSSIGSLARAWRTRIARAPTHASSYFPYATSSLTVRHCFLLSRRQPHVLVYSGIFIYITL